MKSNNIVYSNRIDSKNLDINGISQHDFELLFKSFHSLETLINNIINLHNKFKL
jgi:hypothetical protein